MDIDQLAGTKLGNFEIESLLGRGGMGVVYKARQISLDRPVALKLLLPTLSSDQSFVNRFQREARAVGRLSHSNIVQIYDIDEREGLHFFSMEYIDGRTLDQILNEQGRLGIDEVVRIATQAGLAIEHAHKNSIIHRDIKPSNIICDSDGYVKVMDFGLAKLADRTRLTKTATVMGTVDYMSPEQARGETVDYSTDIWSVGVVIYEMLTGEVPFKGANDQAVIYSILNSELRPISSICKDMPRELDEVVQKMLRKEPGERYKDMGSLIGDLKRAQSDLAVSSTQEKEASPSIAVLPFVNMSADPEQEYFCDGLAEELINALTQLQNLHVAARTSAFFFKGKDFKIRDIGKELNVETVLEGSVRKAGNRVRITAQLVKTDDGYHLWSERYDREMEDIFAIQDEITLAIVDKLKPRLLRDEKAKLARGRAVDLEAYNLYLRGRWFVSRSTQEAFRIAVECFDRAIEKEPDYAAAYAGLADCHILLPFWGLFEPKKTIPKAKEAALRALKLDDNLAEAHASLAIIKSSYSWDWDGGEKEFKKAIKLNPGYSFAHQGYAMHLMYCGRFDQAIAEIKIALEHDPLSLFINRDAGVIYCFAHKPDQAIKVLERTKELDPNYSGVHLSLGMAYLMSSRYEDAIAEFEKEKEVASGLNPHIEAWLGIIYALMGRSDKCRNVLENLLKRYETEYLSPFFIAFLFFSLEDFDQGFEWLDKAYEKNDVLLCFLKVDPAVDALGLRSDPRYNAMLKKIGLDK